MDALLGIVKTINMYLSDYILIILLIGAGLYFTVRTRFVQVRCFGEGLRQVFGGLSFKKKDGASGLNSFQALATAVAAQVGTGNIVGACGAILIGGPGAIFWMWIIAFFGMATIYAEAVLAQDTKVKQADGTYAGGPVYYIKKAFPGKFGTFLAKFFAISAVLALGFMGAMVQSNSIGESCNTAFSIPTWVTGIVVAAVAALIFLGGAKRIASVTEKIVPVMAVLYIVGSIVILVARIKYVPEAFGMIFKYAFRPDALIGGGIGYALKTAISQGAKRGLFSNEAGMGSTPHAHALAEVKKPHDQGVAAMVGVFIDTFVVLTMTGLVVISTLYTSDGILFTGAAKGVEKTNMAMLAFGKVFGSTGANIFVAVCLFFFAFSTIISWNYFGKINFENLFGKKALPVYFVIATVFIFLGSLASNNLVWELTDMFNQLMVLPNVIAIVALGSIVAKSAKK
ncbi:MAG: sodium:alanine symporter family protein [Clostridia bacterium]|nr:sodium:alanine symporter family protein [Clostridia bacterium]